MKLENSLPLQLRRQLRPAADAVEIHPPPRNPLIGRTAVYQQLVEAISKHRSVRICYKSLAERKVIVTRLNPYRLLFSQRSWYVIGRSSLHRSARTFNLGRILSHGTARRQLPHPARLLRRTPSPQRLADDPRAGARP